MSDELRQELEQLVEQWYEQAAEYQERGFTEDYHAIRGCADELAKVLEEAE